MIGWHQDKIIKIVTICFNILPKQIVNARVDSWQIHIKQFVFIRRQSVMGSNCNMTKYNRIEECMLSWRKYIDPHSAWLVVFLVVSLAKLFKKTVKSPMIWDAWTLMWRPVNDACHTSQSYEGISRRVWRLVCKGYVNNTHGKIHWII